MPQQEEVHAIGPATGAGFETTLWSTVLAAGQQDDSTRARDSLEKLCRIYWRPLYSFLRRQGTNPHDAEDLTQGFFASLLQKDALAQVRREKGRFRSFLLASLKNYASDERDKASAQKRGGGKPVLSLDVQDEENQYVVEPADQLDPAKLYDRRWAQTIIAVVVSRLKTDYALRGKSQLYAEISRFLFDKKTDVTREEVARRLGIAVATVDVEVHRLKKLFGEVLRDEVAHTVSSSAEVEEELKHLLASLQP